ncbi:MAG: DUF6580 family putative transport protein [Chitinophagaceae bacterium]
METKKIYLRFTVLTAMILIAAFSRLVPHMPNFSPLGAIGLFGAAHFQKKWQAFLIPIAATWLSDLYINNVVYAQYYPRFTWFYSGFYWTYGTYLLIVLAGILILKKISVQRVLTASLTSTALFFLITNFICWPGNNTDSQDFSGLMNCYVAGIPFLNGTFLGDLFYSGVLFGSFALAQRSFPILRPETPAFLMNKV